MTTIYRFDYSLATADTDGIAESQTPGAAGALTLDGALVTGGVAILGTDRVQRRVLITAAADDSGRTFTVTGTDGYGRTISEDVTGPDTTTASTTLDFQTVTEVSVDAATAGAITVGTSGVGASVVRPMNLYQSPVNISLGASVSGTVDYTVQHTFDDVFQTDDGLTFFPHADLADQTATADGNYAFPVTGIRVLMNSGTGTVSFTIIQGD